MMCCRSTSSTLFSHKLCHIGCFYIALSHNSWTCNIRISSANLNRPIPKANVDIDSRIWSEVCWYRMLFLPPRFEEASLGGTKPEGVRAAVPKGGTSDSLFVTCIRTSRRKQIWVHRFMCGIRSRLGHVQ